MSRKVQAIEDTLWSSGMLEIDKQVHWRWHDGGFWRVLERWAEILEQKRLSNKATRDRKKEARNGRSSTEE